MKTTVEIEDELLIEAKQRAAEERVPLRALVEEGLRLSDACSQGKRRIPWVTAEGGVPPEIRDREGMYAWLDAHS